MMESLASWSVSPFSSLTSKSPAFTGHKPRGYLITFKVSLSTIFPMYENPGQASICKKGTSKDGIFQARVLEWGAIAFSGWLNLCSPIWTMHILETTMKINSKTWHFCPEELTFHILFCIHCLLNYILIIFSIFHLCQKPLLLITLRACLERQYFLGESFSIPEAVTTETQQ